jgi:hypothetical protein
MFLAFFETLAGQIRYTCCIQVEGIPAVGLAFSGGDSSPAL